MKTGDESRLRVRVDREPYAKEEFAIRVGMFGFGKTPARANPLVFTMDDPDGPPVEWQPLMHLSHDDATVFMDELWRIGIRPTEGHGSTGQLGATERHLEDMRSLVFKTTPKNLE